MNNKGQTTVLFSLIISVLFLFTLTALEVGRIYMSKVKTRAVVHSTRSSIMADYNSELFERYHLLFMDPTYGTGSEAALEEKITDYLECSLNGEKGTGSGIYQFCVEEVSLAEKRGILDENMKQLKEQITEYEKTEGIIHKAADLAKKLVQKESDIEGAVRETEMNGVELTTEGDEESIKNHSEDHLDMEVTDPRDTIKEALKFGTLAFVLPKECNISQKEYDFREAPSGQYVKQQEEERDNSFQDIGILKNFLKECAKEESFGGLEKQAVFLDYADSHFSNGVEQREASVLKCELEYILEGKCSDYDNLQGVINEITWLRMPVNYVYLLSDAEKKSEALTLAAAICTATGTEALIEVVKYLLLGCWAYGETLCEMNTLLKGGKIAFIKNKENWNTDLKNLGMGKTMKKVESGLSYADYLMILLARKGGKKSNICYARMLDVMELNLKQNDPDFRFVNCVGELVIQGKISINPLFIKGKHQTLYEVCFEEEISY